MFAPEKWMVGRWSFPFWVSAYFQGKAVSFRDFIFPLRIHGTGIFTYMNSWFVMVNQLVNIPFVPWIRNGIGIPLQETFFFQVGHLSKFYGCVSRPYKQIGSIFLDHFLRPKLGDVFFVKLKALSSLSIYFYPKFSRWWFQAFSIFTPTWGNDPIWLILFKGI